MWWLVLAEESMLEETGIHRKRRDTAVGFKRMPNSCLVKGGGLVFWGGKWHVLRPHS